MIRQLTADEAHVLDHLVDEVMSGKKLPAVMKPGWVRPYILNKVERVRHKIVEPLLDDPAGDRLLRAKQIPMPFGWEFGESEDFDTDEAIARLYGREFSDEESEERQQESYSHALEEGSWFGRRKSGRRVTY
jgi:hypothetical protein